MTAGLLAAVLSGVVAAAAAIVLVYLHTHRMSAWILCLTLVLLLLRRTTAWLLATSAERGGYVHWFDAVFVPIAAATMLLALVFVLATEYVDRDHLRRERDQLADKLRTKT